MDTQSARRSSWLANIGCADGVLSFGFITYAFIYPFVTTVDKHGLEAPLAIGFAVFFFALIGLTLGLVGLIISLIALRRKIKEENSSRGIAVLGLVLNGLVVATVCILLTYTFLFSSPVAPPVMITPSSIVPLPPG